MKKQLIKYRFFFLVLLLPYCFLMFVLIYRIDYRIYLPGGLTEVSEVISFDNSYEQVGSFSTVYVMNINRPTFFQFLVSYFTTGSDISEITSTYYLTISDEDNYQTGQVQKNTSIDTSVIVAYEELELTVDYDIESIIYLKYDFVEDNTVDIGDILLSINNSTDFSDEVDAVLCNETAEFTVRKKDNSIVSYTLKKTETNDTCSFGLGLKTYYNISNTEPKYTYSSNGVGGSSGGLLQTLYIYNQLTDVDITNGLTIAGTGTININGNVGYIGAVEQKVITAVNNDVDIFFVPHLNDSSTDDYIEALAAVKDLKTDMKIVPVSTFDEAITYLLNYGNGE